MKKLFYVIAFSLFLFTSANAQLAYGIKDTTVVDTCIKNIANVVTVEGWYGFGVYSDCTFEKIKIIIYNRWGQQVFETDSLYKGGDAGWDIERVADGTYYYVITYATATNNVAMEKPITGAITVIK